MVKIDMEMPTSCEECRFAVDGWCYVIRAEDEQPSELCYLTRPEWCPLMEVQE